VSEAVTTTAPKPTHPERVRNLLAASSSLSVIANGTRGDLLGPGPRGPALVCSDQGLRLRTPADGWLAREAACAPPGGAPTVLEWTDVAPLAVRERVRGQVRITGRLHPPEPEDDDTVGMLLEPRQITLSTEGFTTLVDPAGVVAAEADPVAPFETALLLHLHEEHRDQVAALTRLVHTRLLLGVTRVTPYALDRYGIVLRLEYHRAHCDVRLAFAEPLTDVDQVGQRIHTLAAHSRCHGGRPTPA
jgi:Protein of unknown function (DUF2470)